MNLFSLVLPQWLATFVMQGQQLTWAKLEDHVLLNTTQLMACSYAFKFNFNMNAIYK